MKVVFCSALNVVNILIKTRFRLVVLIAVISGIVLGWFSSGFFIENDLISKYKLLPDIVKKFVSVQDIWLGMLINTSLPMFLLFSIQFHTLNVKIPFHVRYYIYKALPYIKYVKWLSSKPIIFFIFTASLLVGGVLYLGIIGTWGYLIGLIFPMMIYILSAMLKIAADDIADGTKLSKLTYKYNHCLGNICLIISSSMWAYSSFVKPYMDFSEIIKFLL